MAKRTAKAKRAKAGTEGTAGAGKEESVEIGGAGAADAGGSAGSGSVPGTGVKSILDLAADLMRVEPAAKSTARGVCGTGNFRKKVVSDALAVHPDQIQEQIAHDKKLGVSVEFQSDGRPVFDNSKHFRKYAKAHGFRHRGY